MTKTDRLYQLERLVRSRAPVSFAELRAALEVSPATLKRDLDYLRDRMGVPIVYDRFGNGYRIEGGPAGAAAQELPGLWFDERELYALLMAYQLLSGLDENGTLARHLAPLLERIHRLLGPDNDADARALLKRVHIVGAARRPADAAVFDRVGEALMRRRRLHMVYHTRKRDATSERDVSPQRLVHYRSTWYLDAWCHRRDALLRFALDAMREVRVLEPKAREVPMRQVQAQMDAGYGIFGGRAQETAVLRFDREAAAWVHHELWHPQQQGHWLDDGRWELRLPYASETELVMDLLRHGEQVEVVAPAALRRALLARLKAALARYETVDNRRNPA